MCGVSWNTGRGPRSSARAPRARPPRQPPSARASSPRARPRAPRCKAPRPAPARAPAPRKRPATFPAAPRGASPRSRRAVAPSLRRARRGAAPAPRPAARDARRAGDEDGRVAKRGPRGRRAADRRGRTSGRAASGPPRRGGDHRPGCLTPSGPGLQVMHRCRKDTPHPDAQGAVPLAPALRDRRGAQGGAPGLQGAIQPRVAHPTPRLGQPERAPQTPRGREGRGVSSTSPVSGEPRPLQHLPVVVVRQRQATLLPQCRSGNLPLHRHMPLASSL